jgi:hypothetical protein
LAIAVDDVNVYWAVPGDSPLAPDSGAPGATILSVPLHGGTPQVVASGLASPGAFRPIWASSSLAARNGVVVVALGATRSPGGTIPAQLLSVPRSGGPTTLLATSPADIDSLALDATNVYWIEASSFGTDIAHYDGRIRSAPLNGGPPVVLAGQLLGPSTLVLVGSTLFWETGPTASPVAGTPPVAGGLWSMPVGGGQPTSVEPRAVPGGLAVDATHILWTGALNPRSQVSGLFVANR